MLKRIYKKEALPVLQVIKIYAESLEREGRARYPRDREWLQLQQAEQDFLDYLREDFFPTGGTLAVWEDNGEQVSAVRMLPWRDGILIAGLETRPDCRNCGHGRNLLLEVISCLSADTKMPVYSHVEKNNKSSLHIHYACGFQRVSDRASLLDGTVTDQYYTLKR